MVESKPAEKAVEQDFIIRKSTFIVKNNKKLTDVYELDEANVSTYNLTHCINQSLGKGTYGEVKTVVHKENR